jgi:hypothetical protein
VQNDFKQITGQKMKFIVAILLTALLGFAIGFYMGWWSIAIAAFLVAIFIRQGPGRAWLSGFLGIFLLWAVLAWWIDIKNQSILSQKVAEVFPLGGSVLLLILVTAFIGALVAGFGALTGSYARKK